MIDRSKQCHFLPFFGDRTLGFFDGGVAKAADWRTQTPNRLVPNSERAPLQRGGHLAGQCFVCLPGILS